MMVCRVSFWVTVTLTSNIVLRIIVSGTYLIYYLSLELQIWCLVASWDGSVMYFVLGHCDLDIFSRIIVSGAYLLYYLR